MKSEQWLSAGLTVRLVACGALAWSFQLRPALAVDTTPLSGLPLRVGSWQGAEEPVQGGVEEMLAADFNLQRSYLHPVGGIVWLYVGYYGTERGGRPEHTPWACYPSNGWAVLDPAEVLVDAATQRRANEIVVEKDGERRLVHFWYRSSRRSGMLGGFDQAVERVLGRILTGRADGSLVRLSAPLDASVGGADREQARSRLISFGQLLVPLLSEHWPSELPASDG
jgi:EpsI family protein